MIAAAAGYSTHHVVFMDYSTKGKKEEEMEETSG